MVSYQYIPTLLITWYQRTLGFAIPIVIFDWFIFNMIHTSNNIVVYESFV